MTKWILWNIRGISDRGSFARLKAMISEHRSPLVVIIEPLVAADRIANYALRLCFSYYTSNPTGKIWVFWHSYVGFNILSSSDQVIHGSVTSFTGSPVFCSFVYAKCNYVDRRELWSNFHNFSMSNVGSWIVGGDFNIVASSSECLGSSPSLLAMREFSDMIDNCGFLDIPYMGSMYTWCRSSDSRPLFRRLDRIMVNLPWKHMFHSTSVEHLNRTGSDHAPLLLSIQVAPFVRLGEGVRSTSSHPETTRPSPQSPPVPTESRALPKVDHLSLLTPSSLP